MHHIVSTAIKSNTHLKSEARSAQPKSKKKTQCNYGDNYHGDQVCSVQAK